jgi:RND family efflux transporter MFP subunit
LAEISASRSIEDKLVDEYTSHRDAVREAEISAKEGVTNARENLAAAEARIRVADADIKVADAEVKVAQAELEKAQVLLQFATVVAPFDGVITQRNFFPGDYVRAANEGGSHTSLLTVQRTDKMRVVVQVPDRDVPYCDPGDPAVVEIDALPGEKFPAKVARVARSEDNNTRLMRVEIDLLNPSGRICNGMYGNVTILLEKSKALAIPSSCLVDRTSQDKANVYVVRDGRAHLTPVVIEADNGLRVAIRTGLTSKDAVILHPSSEIEENTEVVVSPGEK